ncbi:toprim domain-containing protein [Roseibium album]|uniref:toprim domain-containing protein n=1 Tax=Roseibium album TaxID=311410 RepID=UPI00249334E4|nr:toprim domain-containing protein [Roseibium album]
MTDRSEIDEVKQLLIARIEEVCHWLLPDGRRIGGKWKANNPLTDKQGQTPELNVWLTGQVGSWKDFRSGDKGDVFGLVAFIHGTDFAGAMKLAKDFLGIRSMSAEERRNNQRRARIERERNDDAARRKEARLRAECEKRFLAGFPYDGGTPAEVHARAYWLEARGIDIDAVPNLDKSSFRFAPSVEYWPLADWRCEGKRWIKAKDGPHFPAIIAAMRGPMGQFVDHHVTFLDPVKPDKATLPLTPKGNKRSPRLMRCPNLGAVIRVSHGPEGLPPEQSNQPHPLILAEGVETALSLALALPEARVWSCGSINGIRNAPVKFPFASALFVAGENDWEKETAQNQLQAALEELETSGKPLELMLSHVGSDFNDLMKGD